MSMLRDLEKKYELISLREQRLVFYALPLVLCFIFVLSLIEPAIANAMKARVDIQNARLQLTTVAQKVEVLELQLTQDPDDETRNQIAAVNQEIAEVEKKFESELSKLVPPSLMPLVLEQLLNKANKLRLVEMESIVPSNIFATENALALEQNPDMESDQRQALPVLFEHGLRIVFEGSYSDTQDFITKAENLDWKVYWDSVSINVNDYPNNTVEIKLFTLSTSEAYLNVR